MTRRPALTVVGATGGAGSVMLQILSQHADVWGEVRLVASARSAGRKLLVRGEECEVLALSEEALDGADVVVFLAPDEIAARWAPVAAAKGAVVVDSSAAFRMDPDVPLVVPELNPHAVRMRPRGIVASPHPTTLAMIVTVGALHAEFGLSELVLSTYEAVSGEGQAAVEALRRQISLVAGTGLGTSPGDVRRAVGDDLGPFAAPVALNVVPWAGELAEEAGPRRNSDSGTNCANCWTCRGFRWPRPVCGSRSSPRTRCRCTPASRTRWTWRGPTRSWRPRRVWCSSTTRPSESSRRPRTWSAPTPRGWAGCAVRRTIRTYWNFSSAVTTSARARP